MPEEKNKYFLRNILRKRSFRHSIVLTCLDERGRAAKVSGKNGQAARRTV